MYNLCESLSRDEIDNFLKLADQNGDGIIRYKEFIRMLKS